MRKIILIISTVLVAAGIIYLVAIPQVLLNQDNQKVSQLRAIINEFDTSWKTNNNLSVRVDLPAGFNFESPGNRSNQSNYITLCGNYNFTRENKADTSLSLKERATALFSAKKGGGNLIHRNELEIERHSAGNSCSTIQYVPFGGILSS